MIAIPNSQCQSSRSPRQNSCASKFEELLPAIQSQARVAFRGLPASEKEELIAETIANAFCAYRRLVERGRAELAYATPLAQYAVRPWPSCKPFEVTEFAILIYIVACFAAAWIYGWTMVVICIVGLLIVAVYLNGFRNGTGGK